MIVGLTGGIASGKSTVSSIFASLGAEIVDADKVARELSDLKENKDKMVEIFGKEILDCNGEIVREKMREKAFENRELLKRLNALLHPQVIKYFTDKKNSLNKGRIIIFDIPLLFESHVEYLCDKIVVVVVPREVQVKRIMTRDGSSKELAQKIIDAQFPQKYKEEHADIVIDNSCSLDELNKKVKAVYEELIDNER